MPEYISVAKAAAKFNLSENEVQSLCRQGRLIGAKSLGADWLIPETAGKPIDAGMKAVQEYKQSGSFNSSCESDDSITLEEVCGLLSISPASGRNWVRLGKITPLVHSKRPLLFSRKAIGQLLEDISGSKKTVLKSRRNKRKVSGTKLYADYVKNPETVETTGELLALLPSDVTEQHIRIILANTALQLSAQANKLPLAEKVAAVEDYLNNGSSYGLPSFLIDDILGNTSDTEFLIPDIKDALCVRFKHSADDVPGFVYMSIKNIGSKKLSGAYYTPANTVSLLLKALKKSTDLAGKICLDPCCGSGNFLLSYAEMTRTPDSVYGQDNDELAVLLTRTNFAIRYGIQSREFLYEHFTIGDSLFSLPKPRYDIVIGNPPWGYVFSDDMVKNLCCRYKSAAANGTESYDLFVERALALLPPGGILAFVLPEAILNVKTHETIRRILIEQAAFSFISYIGNAFTGVQCPAIILGVQKGTKQGEIKVSAEGKDYVISNVHKFTVDNINLRSSDKERDCLETISTIDGKAFLKGNARFALGIVTGNNRQMVLNSREADCEVVLKGSDIRKYKWAASGRYIRFNPGQFQQTAPAEYYRAPEKLLYRFICDTPVFAYDNKQTLSLNSCNILIPQIDELSIKYILAILNSRAVDFYCRQKFNSIKLLRSHIEQIPIPIPNESIQQQVVSAVNDLLADKVSVSAAYEDIDAIVMDLYGLSRSERAVIHEHSRSRNIFLS